MNEYFIQRVSKVFNDLIKKYKFRVEFDQNKVNFISKKLKFTIYFERSLDIYIVFYINIDKKNNFIDLLRVLRYLQISRFDDILRKNQVSSETDIDFVLDGLNDIMTFIIKILYNDDNLLYNIYLFQKNNNRVNYNNHLITIMSRELNEEWKNKEYKRFYEIYLNFKSKNEDIDDYLTDKQKRQIIYSKNNYKYREKFTKDI